MDLTMMLPQQLVNSEQLNSAPVLLPQLQSYPIVPSTMPPPSIPMVPAPITSNVTGGSAMPRQQNAPATVTNPALYPRRPPLSPYMQTPYYNNTMPYGYNSYNSYPGYMMNNPESRFIQLAEESSRPTFQAIESIVRAVHSISFLTESMFGALNMSFRAVLSVVENVSNLQNFMKSLFGSLLAFRIFRRFLSVILTILRNLGLVSKNSHLQNVLEISKDQTKQAFGSTGPSSPVSSWPFIAFMAFIVAAPYLISRMLPNPRECNAVQPQNKPKPKLVRAACNFRARNNNELSVVSGQYLQVIDMTSSPEWILVRNERNEHGFVPKNHLYSDNNNKNNVVMNNMGMNNATTNNLGTNNAGTNSVKMNNVVPNNIGMNPPEWILVRNERNEHGFVPKNHLYSDNNNKNNVVMNNMGMNNATTNNLGTNNAGTNSVKMNNVVPNNIGMNHVASNNVTPNTVGINNITPNTVGLNNVTPNTFGINNITPNTVELNNVTSNTFGTNNVGINNITPNTVELNNVTSNTFGTNNVGINNIIPNTVELNNVTPNTFGTNTVGINNITLNTVELNNVTPNKESNNVTPINVETSDVIRNNVATINVGMHDVSSNNIELNNVTKYSE